MPSQTSDLREAAGTKLDTTDSSSSSLNNKSISTKLPRRAQWRQPASELSPQTTQEETFTDEKTEKWDIYTHIEKIEQDGEVHHHHHHHHHHHLDEYIHHQLDELHHHVDEYIGRLALKERIKHFTWTWFCMTMATGGIANVLYSITPPFRFPGLYTVGCIVFLFNLFLFFFNIFVICLRFHLYPGTFKSSYLHPTESLFVPAAVISVGTVMINITQYGVGPQTGAWLEEVMLVIYWIYCGFAIVLSSGIYLVMWSTQTFTIAQMTPIWIFPAYPLLITGPFAAVLTKKLPSTDDRAIEVIVGGFILQGIGFMVSCMIYSAYLYRLMTQKLPKENLRPGMFISVGPSGFTISGIIGMGQQLSRVVPKTFMGGDGALTARISTIAANWAGLWLWGLAMWFFFVAVGAHFSTITHHRMRFAMNWYSFVFPNTALATATFAVSTALDNNRAFGIVGCILTVALVITWIIVFSMMIRAVWLKQILWPQMQEDRDEGGWGKLKHKKGQVEGNQRKSVVNMLQQNVAVGTPVVERIVDPLLVVAEVLRENGENGIGIGPLDKEGARNGSMNGARGLSSENGKKNGV